MIYQIRVEGQLTPDWSEWFSGLTVSSAEDGDTVLTGALADQAELFGILRQIRDLGLTLVSVLRLGPPASRPAEAASPVDTPSPIP